MHTYSRSLFAIHHKAFHGIPCRPRSLSCFFFRYNLAPAHIDHSTKKTQPTRASRTLESCNLSISGQSSLMHYALCLAKRNGIFSVCSRCTLQFGTASLHGVASSALTSHNLGREVVSEKLSPAPETLRSFRNDDSMTPIGTTMLHHAMPCYAMHQNFVLNVFDCLRLLQAFSITPHAFASHAMSHDCHMFIRFHTCARPC